MLDRSHILLASADACSKDLFVRERRSKITPSTSRAVPRPLRFLLVAASMLFAMASVSSGQTIQLTNVTHPQISPNFRVGDEYRLTVSGPPNQPVSVVQTTNGTTGNPFIFGYTDPSGTFTLSGIQTSANIASYEQVWSVGNSVALDVFYVVTDAPIVAFQNETHPGMEPSFQVGDVFTLNFVGGANQPVTVHQTSNGVTGDPFTFGYTDSNGLYTISGQQTPSLAGFYTQVWSVGGVTTNSAISFVIGQRSSSGTITTTALGYTSDGHLSAVSQLSISNGQVTTYSATELDYEASSYYDAGTVAGLYDEGGLITSNSTTGYGSAGGNLYATATDWHDYDLQTDHYVIAYLAYGGYYENPYYYDDGSCDDYSSDCTIYTGGGPYYVAAASIYLGSTIAHQTDVPQQDTSVPLVDSSAYNSFLSQSGQATPTFSVTTWDKAIADAGAILLTAAAEYKSQHSDNTYDFPYPYLLDLVGDTQSGSGGGSAERDRTYLLEDTYGRPWLNSKPVTVYETLLYQGGAKQVMPTSNNPSTNGGGWSHQNGEMLNGQFLDAYGFQAPGQPVVYFWQRYWATGFNTSSPLNLPPIPGVTGTPGVSDPIVPLILKIKNPQAPGSCSLFGVQGILLSNSYIGVNGDTGPANPAGCPR